jgi:hypothetical protein
MNGLAIENFQFDFFKTLKNSTHCGGKHLIACTGTLVPRLCLGTPCI